MPVHKSNDLNNNNSLHFFNVSRKPMISGHGTKTVKTLIKELFYLINFFNFFIELKY